MKLLKRLCKKSHIVIFFIVFLAIASWIIATNKQKAITVYAWAGSKGYPGEIVFTAKNHWGGINATFHDVGFNGKLDIVLVGEEILEPNSPDWDLWIERYRHIRKKATTGETL